MSPAPTYEALFDRSRAGLPDQRVGGPLGLNGLYRMNDGKADDLRAAKGRWLTDGTFQLVSRSVLEGIEMTADLTFHDDRVDVEFQDNRGVRGRLQGDSKD